MNPRVRPESLTEVPGSGDLSKDLSGLGQHCCPAKQSDRVKMVCGYLKLIFLNISELMGLSGTEDDTTRTDAFSGTLAGGRQA